MVDDGEYAQFNTNINGVKICIAEGDNNNSGANDYAQVGCSGLAQLEEGESFLLQKNSRAQDKLDCRTDLMTSSAINNLCCAAQQILFCVKYSRVF